MTAPCVYTALRREQPYANPVARCCTWHLLGLSHREQKCFYVAWHLIQPRVQTPPENPAELFDFVKQKLLKGSVSAPPAAPPADTHISFHDVTEQQQLTALCK